MKTYTLKELYDLVQAYYDEVGKDSFNPAVGEFVDWMASRDEEQEGKPQLPDELHIHQSQDIRDPDELLDILLDTQAAINAIAWYLKERDQ